MSDNLSMLHTLNNIHLWNTKGETQNDIQVTIHFRCMVKDTMKLNGD